MCGNVSEWTASWTPDNKFPILKGRNFAAPLLPLSERIADDSAKALLMIGDMQDKFTGQQREFEQIKIDLAAFVVHEANNTLNKSRLLERERQILQEKAREQKPT